MLDLADLDEATARALAVEASVDPRTIRRVARGERVRGMAGKRAQKGARRRRPSPAPTSERTAGGAVSAPLPADLEAACDAAATDAAQAKRSELRFLALLNLRCAVPPATAADTTTPALVDKAMVAQTLGTSKASVDRWVLAGMPVHTAGARRRFDLAEVRQWLDARGRRPTSKVQKETDPIPIDDVLRRAGLRVVAGGAK